MGFLEFLGLSKLMEDDIIPQVEEKPKERPTSPKDQELFKVGVTNGGQVTLALTDRGYTITLTMNDNGLNHLINMLQAARETGYGK